jgi:hypothetical protein
MTKPRLLSNLPIKDLTSETDYLGIIDKGDLIKTFLIGNKDQFNEIKMFSLYGEWGSGKSSLMKYLEKELDADFNTFFFEAWEFEKDENLAMSLLEFITSKNTDITEQLCSDILKYGGRILRGLGKSVKLNIPLSPSPQGPNLEFNASALVEEISKDEELTFFKALEKFKTEFVSLEDYITKGDKPKYNIVFIDDLDRCEPEQVLNLLSAIKLFFTYGEKTIFFCGIDKKAVEQAVKTKYGKIVKANEYLEKIFDISFSMPEHDDLLKLTSHYFDTTVYKLDSMEPINSRVSNFFQYLEFTNPRRVKKVLNKYQILRNVKSLSLPEKYSPFPNIDEKDGNQKSYFETILVLYLIILHEFYPEYFAYFLDFDLKLKNYFASLYENKERLSGSKSETKRLIEEAYVSGFSQSPLKVLPLPERIHHCFSLCITPSNIEKIEYSYFNDVDEISKMIVSDNKIEILFYKYISANYINVRKDEFLSNASLLSIKKLIKNAL